MEQSLQANPEWLQLRKQHQQELDQVSIKIENDQREFQRRIDAARARLLAKHSQEERNFWRRHEQKASSSPYPGPSKALPIAPRPSAAPYCAPAPGSVSTSLLAERGSRLKALDSEKQGARIATTAPTALQQAEKPSQQAPQPQPAQPSTKQARTGSTNAAQSSKAGDTKPPTATPSREPPKKQPMVIDLCSSDDEMLVEVSKTTFKERLAMNIKQEEPKASQQVQIGTQPAQHRNLAASTNRLSTIPHPAATVQQRHQLPQSRYAAEPALETVSSTTDKTTVKVSRVLHPQKQGIVSCSSHAMSTDIRSAIPLLKGQCPELVLDRDRRKEQCSTNRQGSLVGPDIDNDIHIEDVPLICLNIPAVLAKMGKTAVGGRNLDVVVSTAETKKPSVSNKDAKKTHLPSPSPSLASVSSTPVADEATTLLNRFKKTIVPPAPRNSTNIGTRALTSQASNCNLARSTMLGPTAAFPRSGSVTSRTSSMSTSSKKRRVVDLSDDEQSTYAPSENSSAAARKKPTLSPGSPLKKPTTTLQAPFGPKRKPPPPSASPLSPRGKETKGLGFRAKPSPITSGTPAPACTGDKSATAIDKNGANTKKNARNAAPTQHKRAVRIRNIDKTIGGDSDEDEDYVEDLDVSKFTHVNGIIVQAGQERRVKETQST